MEIFLKYWILVLSIAGGVGALFKFYLDWLKIKEAHLKITELEEKVKSKSRNIYIPTSEEVHIYSRLNELTETRKGVVEKLNKIKSEKRVEFGALPSDKIDENVEILEEELDYIDKKIVILQKGIVKLFQSHITNGLS